MDAQAGFLNTEESAPATTQRAGIAPIAAAGLIALLLALQLNFALTRSINWDEFFYLSQVHEFARGELTSPLQTLHVRLFAWLPALDLPGVDQIVRGRLMMFACLLVTTGSIIAIAQRFAGLLPALIAALAYLSVGYVVHHATSFRADPLAAALCMASLAILARAKLRWPALLAFGALMGAAVMVTIKIVLLAPAFAGIAWLRWSEARFSLSRAAAILAGPVLAIAAAAAIFVWHSLALAPAGEAAGAIGRSGAVMFGISPNLIFIAKMVTISVPFAVLLLIALRTLALDRSIQRDRRIALSLMMAPLLSLVFYTNTYPYFYAFILPPICAALVVVIPALTSRFRPELIAAILAGNAVMLWAVDGPSHLDRQRAVQEAVSAMFPERISYFDFPGFLPEHRKANFFMTVWGFRTYHSAGEAQFVAAMAAQPVPLLLAVEPEANPSLLAVMERTENARLFAPEDAAALRETYRHIWGPAYVAGITLDAGFARQWTVRVPGTYTVEGTLAVNGVVYQDGDTVTLERGETALAAQGDSAAGLLWGDHMAIPSHPAPERPYWRGF